MNILPKARTENLVEQNLGKEVLLYDLLTHKAFNLNETLAIVYKACDGGQTFEELKRSYKFTDDLVYLALDELRRENLLTEDYQSPFAATNRREVIKKVGLTTMFALPLIAGLVAPKASYAASNRDLATYTAELGAACNEIPYGTFCDRSVGLNCTFGKCCRNPQHIAQDVLPAGARTSSQSCYPIDGSGGATPTCDQFATSCCSGQVSGTCTYDTVGRIEDGILVDDNGDPIICYYENGNSTFNAYPATCNCTCL